jgi:signal transduction histidine kinase
MAAVEKLSYAGEMAAGIAHEVANPVSFIHSNVKVMQEYLEELTPALEFAKKEHPDASEWQDALEDLPSLVHETLEGADRALRIIQDMKSMVRLQSGEHPKKPVSLTSLCQKSLRLLRPRLVGKCKLQVSLDEDAVVLGNEVELSQVLVNLVVNAADACSERHTREEDALVHVQVFRSEEVPFSTEQNPGPRCVLQVQDNGCGIAKNQLERIFAPLFTTKPKGGTGLGLGIVRRIVDAHQGKIRVRSTENIGTIFEVWLPANPG